MEENQNSSLFGLGIDPTAKAHLSEAARWARFLAIVGFIASGLIALVMVFSASTGITLNRYSGSNSVTTNVTGAAATFIGVLYTICIVLIYFFPCLFLFRFSNKIKIALAANDQDSLNVSFQNLKILFRYVGILTIIGLALVALGVFFVMLGAGLASR